MAKGEKLSSGWWQQCFGVQIHSTASLGHKYYYKENEDYKAQVEGVNFCSVTESRNVGINITYGSLFLYGMSVPFLN
jgi:hypothetical protein